MNDQIVDCVTVAERLPWLVNGTLAADEERRVRRHLEGCPSCREELAGTHRALALASGHVPAESLVDYAFESDTSPARRAEIARHVAQCEPCAAELRQVLASRAGHDGDAADEAPSPSSSTPDAPRPRFAWAAALAASVAAATIAAFWWRAEDRARRSAGEVAELTRRLGVDNGAAAPDRGTQPEEQRLRSRLAELESPRVNVAVFELEPLRGGPLLRSGASDRPVNVLDLGSEPVVTFILLAPPLPGSGPHALRLLDANGTEVWRSDALVARPGGDFAVALPASKLPSELFTLQVERRGASALDYPVRVRHRSPPAPQ